MFLLKQSIISCALRDRFGDNLLGGVLEGVLHGEGVRRGGVVRDRLLGERSRRDKRLPLRGPFCFCTCDKRFGLHFKLFRNFCFSILRRYLLARIFLAASTVLGSKRYPRFRNLSLNISRFSPKKGVKIIFTTTRTCTTVEGETGYGDDSHLHNLKIL